MNTRKVRKPLHPVIRCLVVALFAFAIPALSLSATDSLGLSAAHSSKTKKINPSFYVDLGVGWNIFSAPTTDITFGVIGSALANFYDQLTQSGRMINDRFGVVAIGFGYAYPVNRWFNLGLRVFGRYSNNFGSLRGKFDQNTGNFWEESKTDANLRNVEYGVDLTPSVNFGANQTFIGIVGLAFNRVEIQNSAGLFFPNGPRAQNVRDIFKHRNVRGLRLGFNVEELLNQHFGLFMSYVWTGYGSAHLLASGALAFRQDSDVNFKNHNILLGLKYYFSPQRYRRLPAASNRPFKHVYLGLSLGNLIPNYRMTGGVRSQESNAFANFLPNTIRQGDPAPIGVLRLGYGYLGKSHFYIGTELLVSAANRSSKSQFDYHNVTRYLEKNTFVRLNAFEGAFDLKFGGLVVQRMLFFLRTGMALNYLKVRQAVGSLSGVAPNPIFIINQIGARQILALRVGFGIEKLFSDNLALTMNYIYTKYGQKSVVDQVNNNATASLDSNIDVHAATHTVTIGVNYYFL